MGAIESLNNVLYKMEVNAEKKERRIRYLEKALLIMKRKFKILIKEYFYLKKKVL